MYNIWNSLKDASQATIIAATIAVIGVLLSAIISALVSRRSSYISSVTTERSKWINSIRENISNLLGVLSNIRIRCISDESFRTTQDYFSYIKKADMLISTIKLQLNPRGKIDRNIIYILDQLPSQADTIRDSEYRKFENALILHSQFMLKEEWEKVKYEARLYITRPFLWFGKLHRSCEYKKFCKTDDACLK